MAGKSDDPVVLDLIDHRHRLHGGAVGLGPGAGIPLTLFAAEIGERRGRMRIRRTVFEFAGAENFKFDESLTEATVTPPAPFAGMGRFERTAGGTGSWSGSLSVVLPGTKRISLTPPRFGARLYRQGRSGVARPGR